MKKTLFIRIPTEILIKGITGSDIKVYGYILALDNLKNGCTASDATIGKLTGIGARQIRRCLAKMEKLKFIKRHFNTKRNIRICIEPLIKLPSKKDQNPEMTAL